MLMRLGVIIPASHLRLGDALTEIVIAKSL